MRSTYIEAFTALLAGSPAMGQVVIQTDNPDADGHEQRAMQDRADARWQRQEAERRAAIGDYRGAAEAQREARRDWHDANRRRIVIGR